MKKLLSYIVICILAVSCGKENADMAYIKGGDAESEAYLNSGITADPESTDIQLSIRHLPGKLTATCNEYWVEIEESEISGTDDTTRLDIHISGNDGWKGRNAALTLAAEGITREIRIVQRAGQRIETDESAYHAGNDGGDLGIRLKCNVSGKLDVSLKFQDGLHWLSFEEIIVDHVNPGKPECVLHFKALPNDGPGRICGVTVSEEGSSLSTRFCILQQPRPFGEDEMIAVDNPGTLDVLLGNDLDNIRRVRHLTLTGSINSLDWNALRKFFYEGAAADPAPERYPVALDLGKVSPVAGDRSYYYSWGYLPEEVEYFTNQDDYIPGHVLERCVNLTDIVIPEKTVEIGNYAFAYCRSLKKVDIPDEVEVIGNGAFQNCGGITAVGISDASRLKKIGRYAFFGCGPIEYINLPASLTEIDGGYLNFAVRDMRVHWQTPPELRVPPTVKEDGTLYVPDGTSEKYKEAFGWNRFPAIVEFSE